MIIFKKKRKRNKVVRLKNIIYYDCNEKNHYKFDRSHQQKKAINVVKIEKKKSKFR